ncbi:MAG: large subunit ribosomal protein [Desulfovibrionales bacterium]|jgi:large subunit ribosomal protein L10|nr:large subunit ribosomal protein [Desulfovibrionales bacterium]
MISRETKAQIIEQFKEKASRASIAVVTDFKGMPVEESTTLRAKLHELDVDYQVVKNTLGRIGVSGTEHECLQGAFKQNCAVALGYDDPVALAKAIMEFAKGSKFLEVKSASLQGKLLTPEQVQELAKLPGREELLGKMLGTMNAVPTNFVCLFANMLRGLLYALKAIEEQKSAA